MRMNAERSTDVRAMAGELRLMHEPQTRSDELGTLTAASCRAVRCLAPAADTPARFGRRCTRSAA